MIFDINSDLLQGRLGRGHEFKQYDVTLNYTFGNSSIAS